MLVLDLLGMNIAVQDKCGKGSGGYGRPILDENGSLTDIVFSNTGGGYLPRFDGSVGGNGVVTGEASDTICILPEGDIIKFNPGDECVVPPGTTVYFPAGSISNPVPPGTTYEGTPVGGGFTQIDGTPVGGITETGGGFTGVDGTLTVDGDGLPGYGSGYVFVNGGQVSAPVVPPTTVTDSGILSTGGG